MRHTKRHNKTTVYGFYIPMSLLLAFGSLAFLYSSYKPTDDFDWDNIRIEVQDTIKLMAETNYISSGVIGIRPIRPQQWDRRRWAAGNIKSSEWNRLLEYPNGVVRSIAYENLLMRKGNDKYSLLNKALDDTLNLIKYRSGSIGEYQLIGEYLMESIYLFIRVK